MSFDKKEWIERASQMPGLNVLNNEGLKSMYNSAVPDLYPDCTLLPTVCDQAANQLACLCET